ncbi:hypothetical protein EVAR_96734_1 [Eumeta japonica]|uniref:Uncharacterized protein n=1 Tax=Eumeta variegata TaxID=151549 RepID=A0A4C1Y124_EUMVA|nr:hypothetical protein EVAR_96734_1 [Eumeta japonica]
MRRLRFLLNGSYFREEVREKPPARRPNVIDDVLLRGVFVNKPKGYARERRAHLMMKKKDDHHVRSGGRSPAEYIVVKLLELKVEYALAKVTSARAFGNWRGTSQRPTGPARAPSGVDHAAVNSTLLTLSVIDPTTGKALSAYSRARVNNIRTEILRADRRPVRAIIGRKTITTTMAADAYLQISPRGRHFTTRV